MIDPTPRAGWDPPHEAAAASPVGLDGEPGVVPRWGLGDVAIGFFGAEMLGAIAVIVVYAATKYAGGGAVGMGAAFGQVAGHLAIGAAPAYKPPAPLWLVAVVQVPLWAGFLGVPLWATRTKGNGPVRDLGLRARWYDVPIGVAIGVGAQLALVPLIYWPIFKIIGQQDVSGPARELTDRATDSFSILMLILIVGIGAPFAEEIFFRGLTQRSLQRRLGRAVALAGTAVFFAASHVQLVQFPALLVFGLVLGGLAMFTRRLGASISAHLAFNVSAVILAIWVVDLPAWLVVMSGVVGLAALVLLVTLTQREVGAPTALDRPVTASGAPGMTP